MKVSLFLHAIVTKFEKGGYEVDVYKTQGHGDAINAAREAASSKEYDLVVAGGGDGTINEVLNGLLPSPIKLGILPLGTSNGLARELNIPLNPFKSVDAILSGGSEFIDIGIANGRYFGVMLGCGFDAYAIEQTNLRMKRFTGRYAYVFAGLKSIYKYKSHRIKVIADGQKLENDAIFVVVSNAQLYGGKYVLTPEASTNDGEFDVFLYTGTSLTRLIYYGLNLIVHRSPNSKDTMRFRAKNLVLHAEKRVPYQADGDALGELPVQVQIIPSAVEILGARIRDGEGIPDT